MAIRSDSKKVKQGDVFVALRGDVTDGHLYILDAIKNGAIKVIAEEGMYPVETVLVEDTYVYLRDMLDEAYGDEIRQMQLIGVTGTNGKTTITYLLYQALNQLSMKTAYIGTIGFYLEDQVYPLDRTTPQIEEIYEMLHTCYQLGIHTVVLEVSSHALKRNRLDGILFDYAVFTNLTVDHLDFHKTFEDYMTSKQKLFWKVKKSGYAIINSDDSNGKNMINEHNNNLLYGHDLGSDYHLLSYHSDMEGTQFSFVHESVKQEYQTKLLGSYNVSNLMSVIIILLRMGYLESSIQAIVKTLAPPPGRMDVVSFNQAKIVVDYAHTPDAIFNVLILAKQLTKNKIYSIIGCGGNRDKEKRRTMAMYATSLSDYVIMTSDNPRDEDPMEIINDMTSNLYKQNYTSIVDRKKAIAYGIDQLESGDMLFILGKGHESYQIIKNETFYHNDLEYVLQYIK